MIIKPGLALSLAAAFTGLFWPDPLAITQAVCGVALGWLLMELWERYRRGVWHEYE